MKKNKKSGKSEKEPDVDSGAAELNGDSDDEDNKYVIPSYISMILHLVLIKFVNRSQLSVIPCIYICLLHLVGKTDVRVLSLGQVFP